MSSEPLISLSNVSKTYRSYAHPFHGLAARLTGDWFGRYKEFHAVNNVGFDIRKGETVGIIGRNGSGKSTLLQLICGIRKPTSGTIRVGGSISALLELGAGFHSELTGRENVYMQGAIMGVSRERMEARFAGIEAFADIGEFIEQPVKTYSSGMFMRLAFAVAVSMETDILVVDEALAVGDMEFQERSITRMKELRDRGVSILFVSHSMPTVRNFCPRIVWLDQGRVVLDGDANEVSQAYEEQMARRASSSAGHGARGTATAPAVNRRLHASGKEKIVAIDCVTIDSESIGVGSELNVRFALHFSEPEKLSKGFGLGILVHNSSGDLVAIFNTIRDDVYFVDAVSEISLHIERSSFVPGRYWISANICDKNGLFAYDVFDHCASFDVRQEFSLAGLPRWEGKVACDHDWKW